MAFRFALKPETRARMDASTAIVAGQHAMSDVFLAHALLRLARQARLEAPAELANPANRNYDTTFVWQVVPILASRLGSVTLQPNEGTDPDVARLDDRALRILVGHCMKNGGLSMLAEKHRPDPSKPCALDVLGREFVNGNPVAMATDRISPPDPTDDSRKDWLAVHMREISRNRFGDERFLAWEPAFQEWGAEPVEDVEPEETSSLGM